MEKELKRHYTLIVSFLAVALLLAAGFLLLRPTSYELPFAEANVESISFYYSNEGLKKVITTESDIASVCAALNTLSLRGPYHRVPDGGLGFTLVFYLEDGSDWKCTYGQDVSGRGEYTDGDIKRKVENLDLVKLWHQLPQDASRAVVTDEIADPPSLYSDQKK